ncbi:MAG: protein kinase [Bryobacteraceae bacterium]
MEEPIWDQVLRDGLRLNVQLRELLFSDPKRAVLRADYLDFTENVSEVLVRLFLEDETQQEERVSRFLEAKYFEHPHLLRYLETGALLTEQGALTYAITEPGDELATPSLAAEEALRFARHVLSGLEYLHNRNLVYCVLSPHTVVPVGADWKLSDFSQLRVAGTDTSEETLSLRRTWNTCPPEAAEGLISAAWDVWAFGQTLRKVLTNHQANLPDSFRSVLLACLNISPSSRPTLSQVSELLDTTRPNHQQSDLSTAAWA